MESSYYGRHDGVGKGNTQKQENGTEPTGVLQLVVSLVTSSIAMSIITAY